MKKKVVKKVKKVKKPKKIKLVKLSEIEKKALYFYTYFKTPIPKTVAKVYAEMKKNGVNAKNQEEFTVALLKDISKNKLFDDPLFIPVRKAIIKFLKGK
jgi:hypothetical protein